MPHALRHFAVLTALLLTAVHVRADDTIPLRASLCDVLLDRSVVLELAPLVDVSDGDAFLKGLNPERATRAMMHAIAGREPVFTPTAFYEGDGQAVPDWVAENIAQAARGTKFQAHEIRGKHHIRHFLTGLGPLLETARPWYAGRDRIDRFMVLGGAVAVVEAVGLGHFWVEATSVIAAGKALGVSALLGGSWWWLSYASGYERHATELPAIARWLDRVGQTPKDVVITTFKIERSKADERPLLQTLREDVEVRPPNTLLTYAGRKLHRFVRRSRGPASQFWNYAYWDEARREPVLLIGIPH